MALVLTKIKKKRNCDELYNWCSWRTRMFSASFKLNAKKFDINECVWSLLCNVYAIEYDRVFGKLIKFHVWPASEQASKQCCAFYGIIKLIQTPAYLYRPLGDMQVSTYPGRIIVTEPKGLVQPRINVEKHSLRHVVLNGQTTLPCIAQGHPVPTYR